MTHLSAHSAVFVVEDGAVRALLTCPKCSRTMWSKWPEVARFSCSVCGERARVELPRPASA